MLGIDATQRLLGDEFGRMAGGLAGSEIAAIAEDGEDVAAHGLRQLRIGTGRRPKMTCVAGPVLGIFEDIEEMALGHAGA
ncbi:hypothetical protein VQ044_25435, partial [Aurantimonas sp. C2-5-R2]